MTASTLRRLARPLLLLALLLPASAFAGAAPYADWLFQVDRAADARDDARLIELARESPHFARIWFYGNIFDLGVAGIPEKEKARIRLRAERFAEGLSQTEPPDEQARLTLELAGEALAKEQAAQQGLLNLALNDPSPISAAVAALGDTPDGQVPRAAFHALLHRAHLATPRLGGARDALRLVEAARGLAEAMALVDGDLAPWRTLAAWQGGEVVTADKPTLVEERIINGFNALLTGDPGTAQRLLDDGVRALSAAGEPPLRVSLMSLGGGLVADLRQDAAGARAVRARVASTLQVPWMVASLHRQILLGHVRSGDPDGAVRAAETFRRSREGVRPRVEDGTALNAAVVLWRVEARQRFEAGRLESAEQLLAAARVEADWLRSLEFLGATVAEGRRAAEARTRAGRASELAAGFGALAHRRGRFNAAIEAFEGARASAAEAADARLEGLAGVALGRSLLAAGRLDDALTATTAAVDRLRAGGGDAYADACLARGEVRLWRGDLAPAFANANEGLRAIAGGDAVARGRLHRLAAAALFADGQTAAAVERLRFAVTVSDDAATAVALATALATTGALADGRAALAAHVADPDAAVADGCLAARAGAAAAAAERLTPWVTGTDGDVDRRVRAGACLVAALDGAKDRARVAGAVAAVDAVLAHADPAESAAWLAVSAGLDAAQARARTEAAIRDWNLGRGDGHARHLLVERPRAAEHPGAAVQAVVDAALKGKDDMAALPLAVWWQRARLALATPAPRPQVDVPAAALSAARGALAQAWSLGRVLADGAVEPAARQEALLARQAAFGALATAVAAAREAAPRYLAASAPTLPKVADLTAPAGRVRSWYVLGTQESRVFTASPATKALRSDPLPGRAAVAALAGDVIKALGAGAPAELLARAGATLVPQAPALADNGHPLEIEADGPLGLFPFGALTVGGKPLAGQRAVRFRLGLAAPAGAEALGPVGVVAVCPEGECPALDAMAQAGLDVAGPLGLEVARGRVQIGAKVTAGGLMVAGAAWSMAPLARADGRLGEVVFSARAPELTPKDAEARVETGRRAAAAALQGGAGVVVVPGLPGELATLALWRRAQGHHARVVHTLGVPMTTVREDVVGPARPLADAVADWQRFTAQQSTDLPDGGAAYLAGPIVFVP
ncbi:MAG: hypothetical protein H6706_17515 [Myxococcales bacterium]|nr:hypothetical protein [Myxococcales bacterium]